MCTLLQRCSCSSVRNPTSENTIERAEPDVLLGGRSAGLVYDRRDGDGLDEKFSKHLSARRRVRLYGSLEAGETRQHPFQPCRTIRGVVLGSLKAV